MKPVREEIPEFYRPYIDALPEGNLTDLLNRLGKELVETLHGRSESIGDHAYDEGKWSIKEVLQHIIDAERVFTYRALTMARGDQTDLPGFEQNEWVENCSARHRSMHALLGEFANVRKSTLDLFDSLNEEELKRKGTANGHSFSANVIGYITAGHQAHHLKIIRERYLD